MDYFTKADFILIRHVFIHLKNENINKIISRIKKKEFKFLGITSDPKLLINKDLKTEGRYRDINLLIEPFNLNAHYEEINESKNGIEDNVNLNIYNSKIR